MRSDRNLAACESLEVEIERAWCELTRERSPRYRLGRPVRRTYVLTRRGKLEWGHRIDRYSPEFVEEVGTYTPSVTLQQFREDVFEAHDIMHGGRHG